MIKDRLQQHRDEDRKKRGAFFGGCSLVIMLIFVLLAGTVFGSNQLAAMWLIWLCELLLLPPAAWMAVRCLATTGGGWKIHAGIALILIGMVLIGQLVELWPYIRAGSW